MDFMTTEYVAEQAKDEISALECSLKHHRQGEKATLRELLDAIEDEKFEINQNLCAVCEYVDGCDGCPLYEGVGCCNLLTGKANSALAIFKADPSSAHFKAFQEAEGKVCEYISGVLERKRAEQEEPIPERLCMNCEHRPLSTLVSPCDVCMDISSRPKWKPKESKPALRHGDYGSYLDGELWIILDRKGILEVFGTNMGSGTPVDSVKEICVVGRLGNLIDDLALRAEDLTEFEIAPQKGDSGKMVVSIDGCGDFWFDFGNGRCRGFDRTVNFHQKLGQMIATAKRKQKSK